MDDTKDIKRSGSDINENDEDDDSSVDLAFASLDMTGVDFDDDNAVTASKDACDNTNKFSPIEQTALMIERSLLQLQKINDDNENYDNMQDPQLQHLLELRSWLRLGEYTQVLQHCQIIQRWTTDYKNKSNTNFPSSVWEYIQSKYNCDEITLLEKIQLECVGIAAFNLFLQFNYTGPLIDNFEEQYNQQINPHLFLKQTLQANHDNNNETQKQYKTMKHVTAYQNAILAELAVDGVWPCQVVQMPYYLLLARCIFLSLTKNANMYWGISTTSANSITTKIYKNHDTPLWSIHLWNARSAVAHERLLLSREPTMTLWNQVKSIFEKCLETYNNVDSSLQAVIWLEWGLAQHYFDRPKMGKEQFERAMNISGLTIEVTGAEGVRTKFQTKATAQLVVKATSANAPVDYQHEENQENYAKNDNNHSSSVLATIDETPVQQQQDGNVSFESKEDNGDTVENNNNNSNINPQDVVKSQMVQHTEDGILLERVKFKNNDENKVTYLSILDQAILLAFCLDVKNHNPTDDVLTNEQMGAYLARVLCHSDDWMVYSTALLERAWLEFDRSHTKERAILQMQALADQHTNRLTITQSTRKSIEDDSSPVQDRLQNLHSIVYPPRWHMLRDIAERYARLGIVTSAAELFTEIEYWDEVVICYRRAGKEQRATEIVKERLEIAETPRMWTALGDLTNDPNHYQKAITLSKGRFAGAYIALGQYYFEQKELVKAADNYRQAVRLRPLSPAIWFKLGTISMQLEDWDSALTAFSEVVQQNPEEAEGWANVAAVHMHNKKPTEAYPALVESLKQNRNNWRVWISKLYTCLDLNKIDEATQACTILLDFRISKPKDVPPLEERCVRAIVGGALTNYQTAKTKVNDMTDMEREKDILSANLESCRRTLTRVLDLLERLSASSDSTESSWIYETLAYLHEQVGQDEHVLENLMKEYRSLQTVRGWEKDDIQVRKIYEVVRQIVQLQKRNNQSFTKSKFLLRGVIGQIKQARMDTMMKLPEEVQMLEKILDEINK